MPWGKYYCDYCDKEFQDSPSARKRHISGLQHQRARAHWYDSFKDPNGYGTPLLQPDGTFRGVCHHFVRTGVCKYGDTCKYYHPVQTANPSPPAVGLSVSKSSNLGGNQLVGGSSVSGDAPRLSWGNLPPSLRSPPEGGYPALPFVDWGW